MGKSMQLAHEEPIPKGVPDKETCTKILEGLLFGEASYGPDAEVNPGNFDKYDYGLCEQQQEKFLAEAPSLAKYNREHGWKEMSYWARDSKFYATKENFHPVVSAWVLKKQLTDASYFPAPVKSDFTFILVPGAKSEWRSHYLLIIASRLRALGNNVFLIHEWSTMDGTADLTAVDVLGAADVISKGEHGVAKSPWNKIGVVGFSYGSKAAQVAFMLEPRLTAMWCDGVYYDQKVNQKAIAKDVIVGQMKTPRQFDDTVKALGAPLLAPMADYIAEQTYKCFKYHRKWTIEVNNATGKLEDTGSPHMFIWTMPSLGRHVALTNAISDDLTVIEQAYEAAADYKKHGYNVTTWFPPDRDNPHATCMTHLTVKYMYPKEYQAKLCAYFTKAMGESPCK